MKIILLASIALLFVITPVYGQFLSDATGLVNRLDVQSGGYSFEIETVSNFHISDYSFDKNEKKLTLLIQSSLENNLGEVQIPQNLLGGNFTFYLNGNYYEPEIKSNDVISFVTLNFTGSGENKLEIVGTTYLSGLTEIASDAPEPSAQPGPSPAAEYDNEMIYVIAIIVGVIIAAVIIAVVFSKKRK